MTDHPQIDSASSERTRIHGETAKIRWVELQRFFAQGNAIAIAPELDLVEVAYQMSCDNSEQFAAWLASGAVGPVADVQALKWLEADVLVWSVVVRPWVLVQPVANGDSMSVQEEGLNGNE